MAKIIDLSNVINVTISLTPTVLSNKNINTIALFTTDTPSWGDAYKIYLNSTDVGTDFGTTSNSYKIAAKLFSQQPNPLSTGGYLVIIPRQAGPEAIGDAIVRTISSVYYFGVIIDQEMHAESATFATLATYIQSIDKVLFVASSVKGDYAPGGMFDLVRSGSETHTRCIFYSDGTAIDTITAAAAYAGRALSTDFTGSLTAQTMHLKALAGVVPDTTVDQTELTAIGTAGVDCYVNLGVSALFTSGKNKFFDQIYNSFWLKFALQTAGFNFLRGTNTKIPQTESGMHGLKGAYQNICAQAITNGYGAPGSWTSPDTFGNPADLIRNIKDVGYYIYSQPISQQSAADRTDRKAPLVQIALKEAGALHSSNVIVSVNP